MTISITWDHIRAGLPGECGYCPIALAFREAFPGKRVDVIGPTVFLGRTAYDLPMACVDFVGRFDNGFETFPFSFEFDLGAANAEWRRL